MITRQVVHDELDRKFDEWKYGDLIPIKKGKIIVEISIENGNESLIVTERMLEVINKR